LSRDVVLHFTVNEEIGYGPIINTSNVYGEILAIDNGCVGNGLNCTEKQVSICAKDSHGPYSYDIVKKLIEIARNNNIDYAVDVYPDYNSDAGSALCYGIDAKHALIGPGVYASHGYERSHLKAVDNLLKLLFLYLK
jgi:putative aminopeptidase FrvX